MIYINKRTEDGKKNINIAVSDKFYRKYSRARSSAAKAKEKIDEFNEKVSPEYAKANNKLKKANEKLKPFTEELNGLEKKAIEQPELQRAEVIHGGSLINGKFTKAKKRKDNSVIAFCTTGLVFSVASVAIVVATGGAALPIFIALAAFNIPVLSLAIRVVFKAKKRNRETESKIEKEKSDLNNQNTQLYQPLQKLNNLQHSLFTDKVRDLSTIEEELLDDNEAKSNLQKTVDFPDDEYDNSLANNLAKSSVKDEEEKDEIVVLPSKLENETCFLGTHRYSSSSEEESLYNNKAISNLPKSDYIPYDKVKANFLDDKSLSINLAKSSVIDKEEKKKKEALSNDNEFGYSIYLSDTHRDSPSSLEESLDGKIASNDLLINLPKPDANPYNKVNANLLDDNSLPNPLNWSVKYPKRKKENKSKASSNDFGYFIDVSDTHNDSSSIEDESLDDNEVRLNFHRDLPKLDAIPYYEVDESASEDNNNDSSVTYPSDESNTDAQDDNSEGEDVTTKIPVSPIGQKAANTIESADDSEEEIVFSTTDEASVLSENMLPNNETQPSAVLTETEISDLCTTQGQVEESKSQYSTDTEDNTTYSVRDEESDVEAALILTKEENLSSFKNKQQDLDLLPTAKKKHEVGNLNSIEKESDEYAKNYKVEEPSDEDESQISSIAVLKSANTSRNEKKELDLSQLGTKTEKTKPLDIREKRIKRLRESYQKKYFKNKIS